MKSEFIHFQDIFFSRQHLQVMSGLSIDPNNPEGKPFFRVILRDGVEWRITANTEEDLLKQRHALIAQL